MAYFYRHANDPINYFSVSFRIIGILAFVLSCCGFFTLNIRDPEQFQAGGYLGSIVVESLLPVISSLVASLALLATTLACVTLLTGFSWLYLFEKIGALVMLILSPIKWLFTPDKVPQPTDSNQDNESVTEMQPKFDLSIDADSSDNKGIDLIKLTTNNSAISAESDTTKLNPSLLKNDEKFIKTAAQLLQTIEANTSTSENTQSTENVSKKEMDPDAILARMEKILKNMNEGTTNDISSFDGQANNREVIQPFEEDKYAIADAPSKPLFTMRQEPEINLNITSQESIEPMLEDKITPSITHQYNNTNDIPNNFEIPEDVDISLLKEENPLIDDIYQNEVVIEENQQPINNKIKEVEVEEDSLIHPLLKRNDKPLKKPTTPLPSLNLLTPPPTTRIEVDHAALNAMSEQIEKSLSDYRVKARVVDYLPGPVITRFEIELAPGIKAARISTLDRDLARSLSMPSVRVVEVIPGKPYVGIELPNQNRQTVYFREVLDSPQFKDAQSPLTVVLGKDIAGQSVVADLAKMPHLLVAGTTGSGKSVGVNAMILSLSLIHI